MKPPLKYSIGRMYGITKSVCSSSAPRYFSYEYKKHCRKSSKYLSKTRYNYNSDFIFNSSGNMDRKTFILCYLISIATILGSGLLGLPVSIAKSGLIPFLFTFTLNLIAQIAVVSLILELLQAVHVIRTNEINQQIKEADQNANQVSNNTVGMDQQPNQGLNPTTHNLIDVTTNNLGQSNMMGGNQYSQYNQNNNNNFGLEDSQFANVVGDNNEKTNNTNNDFDLSQFDEPEMNPNVAPTFYCLGNVFLKDRPVLKFIFVCSMLLNFLSLLISYCLAGTQAYAGILPGKGLVEFFNASSLNSFNAALQRAPIQGIGFIWLLIFTLSLSYMILYYSQKAQFVVQVLTTAKALILALSVFTVLLLSFGSSIVTNPQENWGEMGSGFLMGTVALGEAAQVLPLLYCQLEKPNIYSLKELRKSVILALVTCYVLGVLWCTAILDLIPQGIDMKNYCYQQRIGLDKIQLDQITNTNPQSFGEITQFDVICNKGISLTQASDRGMISSNPLTQLLDSYSHLGYGWLAMSIRFFVALSITVSFLAVGSAMYHALKGWTAHLYELCIRHAPSNVDDPKFTIFEKCEIKVLQLIGPVLSRLENDTQRHRCVGTAIFGLVTLIALINPKGFSSMLKYQTSLSLNLLSGPLLWLMIQYRRTNYSMLNLPLKTKGQMEQVHHACGIFFMLAIIYAVFSLLGNLF